MNLRINKAFTDFAYVLFLGVGFLVAVSALIVMLLSHSIGESKKWHARHCSECR